MNATRTILSDVLWRWQRGITRAMLLIGVLAGMTLGAPAHAQIAYRAASQASSSGGQPAPAFRAAGAAISGTGNVTPAWPAHAIGDVALLFIESAGGEAATLSVPAGFVAVTNSPQATGAGTAGTRLTVFWARATSATMPAPTVLDPGDHVYAQILTYRGVIGSGNPWDVTGGGIKAVASTSVTVTGVTTTMPNTLIVQAVARDADLATAAFTAQTNANLTGIAERSDAGTTANNGGGIGIWDGVKATAGATGNTTATVTSSVNAFLTIALRPPDSVLTVNVPAGTLANDVMVASFTYRPCSNTSGAACTTTITPPAGWTQVNTVTDQTTGGGTGGFGNRIFVYRRIATGAEPASYTWTFSGQVVHNGAAGGIISFSGVDTASPVVVEAGQTTASGTSHAAPSINTGAVTNTMLVSSHSANSSAAWTPPAGMTERVDIASQVVPNDLGDGLEVNHELFAGAGATGARTASWTSPPAADTGITHMLALRPAVVVVPPPGGFNVVETSTPPGATTGVIRTKIAGMAFSLDVVAISGGVQQAGFTDAVIVELLGNNTLGVPLDAQNCPTSFTVVQTVVPNPTITGGRSTVNFAAVANSWRDVRVRVRWPTASPTVTWCSTDNFAIRPSSVTVSVTDATWTTAGNTRTLSNTGVSGGTVHKAGQPFRITAVAQPGTATLYAGSPIVKTATCLALAGMTGCTSVALSLPGGGWSGSGTRVNDSATYGEAGALSLELEDQDFASVDAADSTTAERFIPQTGGTLQVGRFVPDRFVVTAPNTPQFQTFGAACAGARSFTYVGQTFGYVTVPVAMVTAQNAAGGTTANYRESLWKITTAAPSDVTQTYSNNAVGPSLDTTQANNAPTVISVNDGTGTVTVNTLDRISYQRTTPIALFNANISLTITVRDDSEADGQITTASASPWNAIAFDSGNEFRFGRLVIRNENGSQLVPLPILVEAQYWGYTNPPANTVLGFITNTADNCTSIAAANEAMGNYTGNLSGSPTCETAISGGGTLSAGRRTLRLAAPGSGNNGSVDLTVNLGAAASGNTCTTVGGAPGSATTANLPYLQGNWTGGAYDQNPTGRATFGVFKGSAEVIFIRENF